MSRGARELRPIVLTVRNIDEAVRWYDETLGLPRLFTFSKVALFDLEGRRLYLVEESEGAEKSRSMMQQPIEP